MKKKLSKPVKVGDVVYKYVPMVKKVERKGGDATIEIKSGNRTAVINKKDKGFFSDSDYELKIEDDQGPIFETNDEMEKGTETTANRLRNEFPEICEKKESLSNGKFIDSWRTLRKKVEEKCQK